MQCSPALPLFAVCCCQSTRCLREGQYCHQLATQAAVWGGPTHGAVRVEGLLVGLGAHVLAAPAQSETRTDNSFVNICALALTPISQCTHALHPHTAPNTHSSSQTNNCVTLDVTRTCRMPRALISNACAWAAEVSVPKACVCVFAHV